MLNSAFCPIDKILSDDTIPGQSDLGSTDNKEVLHIHQILHRGASSSDCLVSDPGHLLWRGLTPLQRCSPCILQPQPTGYYGSADIAFIRWDIATEIFEMVY